MIAPSSAESTRCTFFLRQASEQYLTFGQFLAHFARHVISRPHRAQTFGACSAIDAPDGAAEREHVEIVVGPHDGDR